MAIVIASIVLFIAVLKLTGLLGDGLKNISNSYLTEYSETVTIGDAFDDFFANPKWVSYKEGAQQLIDFSGECTCEGESANRVLHFL